MNSRCKRYAKLSPPLRRLKHSVGKKIRDIIRKCDNDLICDTIAAIVERFNRTLKTRMYRYFTQSKSYRYVDVLQDLVQSYNHTYHSSIGMAPASVSVKNERLVRQKLFHKHPEKPK